MNKSTLKSSARLKIICISEPKNFFTGSIDKFESKRQGFTVKTSKPNFVTFFVYFGNRLLSCERSLFTAANREGILLAFYASLASLTRRNWR